jgi:hypothetical protein
LQKIAAQRGWFKATTASGRAGLSSCDFYVGNQRGDANIDGWRDGLDLGYDQWNSVYDLVATDPNLIACQCTACHIEHPDGGNFRHP